MSRSEVQLRKAVPFSISRQAPHLHHQDAGGPRMCRFWEGEAGGFAARARRYISHMGIAVPGNSQIRALLLPFPMSCLRAVCLFSTQPHERLFLHHRNYP